MQALFRFFAQRHLLANVLVILIVTLGLVSFHKMPREVYPHVDMGFQVITTYYPGASPEEVELKITNEIEKQLKGWVNACPGDENSDCPIIEDLTK